MLLVLVGAALHATWNVLVKGGGDRHLDTVGVVGNIAIFTVWWTMGIALRARREALEARVRQAEERFVGRIWDDAGRFETGCVGAHDGEDA